MRGEWAVEASIKNDTLRFERRVEWAIEPCESCGRKLWWWASQEPGRYSGRFFEYDEATVLRGSIGVHHTPQRCRELR